MCVAWRVFYACLSSRAAAGESVQPADGTSGEGRGNFGGLKKQQNTTMYDKTMGQKCGHCPEFTGQCVCGAQSDGGCREEVSGRAKAW